MLRWGILGTSFISEVVVQSILASPGSIVVAVFSRSEVHVAAFAEKHGIATWYTSMDELLDDANVDVVYVGLPNHVHSSAVIAAAKRGKAILSEKSLATTTDDSHAMMEAVQKENVFFLEGLMYLCHPLMDEVMAIIQKGTIGTVRAVSGYYAANIWKKANPLGMGTIYNLGCYPVSLLQLILETAYGPDAFAARQVQGYGNFSTEGNLHVRDASLNVRFANGVMASIQSTDSFGNDFSFTIQGDKGVLRFLTNPWLPLAGENVIEVKKYGDAPERVVVPATLDAFGYQVKKVEECLQRGFKQASRPSPSLRQSVEIMGLLSEWEADIKCKCLQNVSADM